VNPIEGIKAAFSTLLANKVRSFLTMLGVIIGVASVIALVSLGQGAQAQVEAQITQLGTNLITVNASGYARFQAPDVADILSRVPSLSMATPDVTQSVTAKVMDLTYDTRYEGVSEDFPAIRNYTVAQGRFFDEEEIRLRKKVAVLGWTVYQNLVKNRSAVGEMLTLKGQVFQIIGVTAQKGSTGGESYDDRIFLPYSAAQRLAGTRYFNTIIFKVGNPDDAAEATTRLNAVLESKFRITTRTRDQRQQRIPFRVSSQDELLSTMNQMTSTFTALLSGIASVSLLVGGIGIMNIMLVSVTERTREIGIRKAIGARKKDIVFQFLLEAVVVSALGGILGIATGTQLASILGQMNGMIVVVSPEAVLLSFAVSSLVGLFFGVYPAFKAAGLDPIVALRYE
jgi:putative ABC transport system permease protein